MQFNVIPRTKLIIIGYIIYMKNSSVVRCWSHCIFVLKLINFRPITSKCTSMMFIYCFCGYVTLDLSVYQKIISVGICLTVKYIITNITGTLLYFCVLQSCYISSLHYRIISKAHVSWSTIWEL